MPNYSISVSPSDGVEINGSNITFPQNNGTKNKTYKITIAQEGTGCSATTVVKNVVVSPFSSDSFFDVVLVNKTNMLPSSGGQFCFNIISYKTTSSGNTPTKWSLKSKPSWAGDGPSSGSGSTTGEEVCYTISATTSTTNLSGSFKFKSGTNEKEISVGQYGVGSEDYVINVISPTDSIPSSGGSVCLTIISYKHNDATNGNVASSWTLKNKPSWLSGPTSGVGSVIGEQVCYSASSMTSKSGRCKSDLTFQSNGDSGKTDTGSICQDGKGATKYVLSISPLSQTFPKNGGTKCVEIKSYSVNQGVTTPEPWELKNTLPSWMSGATSGSGSVSGEKVCYSGSASTSVSATSDSTLKYMISSHSGTTASTKFNQEGTGETTYNIEATTTTELIPASGGTKCIKIISYGLNNGIKTPTPWTLTNKPTWLSGETSGSGSVTGEKICYEASENSDSGRCIDLNFQISASSSDTSSVEVCQDKGDSYHIVDKKWYMRLRNATYGCNSYYYYKSLVGYEDNTEMSEPTTVSITPFSGRTSTNRYGTPVIHAYTGYDFWEIQKWVNDNNPSDYHFRGPFVIHRINDWYRGDTPIQGEKVGYTSFTGELCDWMSGTTKVCDETKSFTVKSQGETWIGTCPYAVDTDTSSSYDMELNPTQPTETELIGDMIYATHTHDCSKIKNDNHAKYYNNGEFLNAIIATIDDGTTPLPTNTQYNAEMTRYWNTYQIGINDCREDDNRTDEAYIFMPKKAMENPIAYSNRYFYEGFNGNGNAVTDNQINCPSCPFNGNDKNGYPLCQTKYYFNLKYTAQTGEKWYEGPKHIGGILPKDSDSIKRK